MGRLALLFLVACAQEAPRPAVYHCSRSTVGQCWVGSCPLGAGHCVDAPDAWCSRGGQMACFLNEAQCEAAGGHDCRQRPPDAERGQPFPASP